MRARLFRYLVCLVHTVRTPLLATWVVVLCNAAISGRTAIGPAAAAGAGALPLIPLAADDEPLHRGYVDGATGTYYRKDDDIVLAGTPRFVLERTYRSRDPISRQFGVGATHNGERYLRGNAEDLR